MPLLRTRCLSRSILLCHSILPQSRTSWASGRRGLSTECLLLLLLVYPALPSIQSRTAATSLSSLAINPKQDTRMIKLFTGTKAHVYCIRDVLVPGSRTVLRKAVRFGQPVLLLLALSICLCVCVCV
eukprot:scpid92806/ scgid26207/ 